MKTNSEIKYEGYQALVSALGYVYAEKFISLLQQETFDYTLWQRNLWDKEDVEELSKHAMKYLEENK